MKTQHYPTSLAEAQARKSYTKYEELSLREKELVDRIVEAEKRIKWLPPKISDKIWKDVIKVMKQTNKII